MFNKFVISIFAACILSGCASIKPEVQTVTKIKYVRDDIPETLLTIPDAPAKLNVDDPKLTQKDVSLWIVNHMEYEKTLKTMICKIKEYQESRKLEIEKLNEEGK